MPKKIGDMLPDYVKLFPELLNFLKVMILYLQVVSFIVLKTYEVAFASLNYKISWKDGMKIP